METYSEEARRCVHSGDAGQRWCTISSAWINIGNSKVFSLWVRQHTHAHMP